MFFKKQTTVVKSLVAVVCLSTMSRATRYAYEYMHVTYIATIITLRMIYKIKI